MSHGKIKALPSSVERIQYQLAERLIKPLSWVSFKILAFVRGLRFFQYTLKFGQRPDDIYICTFMKSGTTLLQMMVYQLTTSGEINFDHIYQVSPWIRNDAFHGRPPLNFPSPRIIKSHDPYPNFEKRTRGRFIHVIRNGKDVAASLYHQNRNYSNPDLKFDELFRRFFVKKGRMNWFTYNRKWLENKNKFEILYLNYEDLLDDKEGMIRKVAGFLKIELTPELLDRTMARTSFEFMKEHEQKFGEQPAERVYNQFIRKGKKGEGELFLSDQQKAFFQKQLDKHLANLYK